MSQRLDSWEIASRLTTGLPRLSLVIVPTGEVERAAKGISQELSCLLDRSAQRVSARELSTLEHMVDLGEPTVVDVEQLSDADWRLIDRSRSRLEPRAHVAFVVTEPTARRMATLAPNLASWLATAVYQWRDDAETSDQQRDDLVAALSARYGMDSEEAVRRAGAREPPYGEPEFSLWLVLLGRGDLVEPGNG